MVVQCKGAYGIERAEELRNLLLGPLAEGGEIVVDFSGVEHADYTFFQIIHSAIKTYQGAGQDLVLQSNLPPCLADQAARMGLGGLAAGEEAAV